MQIRLILIILGFCSLDVYADEIPTLDLSENHSYSQIAKGGILVDKPARGSQGILNKEFKIKIADGKEFTSNSGGLLYCAPGETNIQFIYFTTGFLTENETRQKITEFAKVLDWTTNDCSEWIDIKTEKSRWRKVEEKKLPYHYVEIEQSFLPETPYAIRITLAWDTNILEKVCPEIRTLRLFKKIQ